jgi:hypothetical protein
MGGWRGRSGWGFATSPLSRRDQSHNYVGALWAAGKLADYAASLGLELVPGAVFHPPVIERFARSAPGVSGVARRTLRTNQRFIARRVVPQLYPADVPLPRERSKAPYTAAEIGGFLALADAQPTAERRMRAAGLVCLGAGAGLIRGDLRDARGTDMACRSGGVVVTVHGARLRTVPVLGRYHARLLAAAEFAGTGLICGGSAPGRRNITNPLITALDGGGGLPRLDTSRLRATWLADCGEMPGLATFMHAAGISCSQRPGDLVAGLGPPPPRAHARPTRLRAPVRVAAGPESSSTNSDPAGCLQPTRELGSRPR